MVKHIFIIHYHVSELPKIGYSESDLMIKLNETLNTF